MADTIQVFISYRRDGGEDLARLLEDNLKDRGYSVFFDVESLRSGAFNTALFEKIDEATDVLVVLPPHGLDRCKDPNDWVRQEIAYALKKEKNVIPVMMRNFTFPDQLPEDIDRLRYMNGIAASNEFFNAVIEKLTHFLKSLPVGGRITDEQLQSAVKQGDIQAMNLLGLRYELGSETLVANQTQSVSLYREAGAAGHPGALFNLADVYEQCSKDLTLLYDYGLDSEVDGMDASRARVYLSDRAKEYYALSAKAGFAPAVYRIGNLHEERNELSQAFECYRNAASQGFPPAQNAVGYYLMNGVASRPDPTAAIAYYKKAAENGYAPGAFNYAQAVELLDLDAAVSMYRRVAFGEHAIPQAAYALGVIYENHLNDLHSAVTYYHIAAKAGLEAAEKALKRCQDTLFSKSSAMRT